jgi:hypothetical protein
MTEPHQLLLCHQPKRTRVKLAAGVQQGAPHVLREISRVQNQKCGQASQSLRRIVAFT